MTHTIRSVCYIPIVQYLISCGVSSPPLAANESNNQRYPVALRWGDSFHKVIPVMLKAICSSLVILHIGRIAKAIVFRCSDTERLSLLSFANANSRSI